MAIRPLAILVPCHGWEDFPTHYRGPDAARVLTAWTAAWHPQILAAARTLPDWVHPDHLAQRLDVEPCLTLVPDPIDIPAERDPADKCLGVEERSRTELVAAICRSFDWAPAADADDHADLFFALGYATLQIQLLTRQMRYSSSLDEEQFEQTVVEAAQAAVRGDTAAAQQGVGSAFDLLSQQRDHYYPVDVFLLDLVLVAPTTLGHSLKQEIDETTTKNIALTGDLLESLAADRPSTLQKMRERVGQASLGLVGGEPYEGRLPLWPPEDVRRHLLQGRAQFERHLGAAPEVYGRRTFGLAPSLPHVLNQCGFRAALHFTLDDGRFPATYQSKTTWEGCSGQQMDVLARAPQDASQPETLLYLARALGESIDGDHVATCSIAHWPAQGGPWLRDLRHVAAISHVLGKFVRLEEYFNEGDYTGHHERFEADAYRSPYLEQDVETGRTDPVTHVVSRWQQAQERAGCENLNTMTNLVAAGTGNPLPPPVTDDDATQRRGELVTQFAQQMAGAQGEQTDRPGWLAVNPYGTTRRVCLRLPGVDSSQLAPQNIVAATTLEGACHVVVDLPAMGYQWFPATQNAPQTAAHGPQIVDGDVLQNEFLQVTIDRQTGGVGAVHDYRHRHNLLTQRLALRSNQSGAVVYSSMAADRVSVEVNSEVCGIVRSAGRLVNADDSVVAAYQQTVSLWRGSRTLWLDVEIEPHADLQGSPWENYFASRIAWKSIGASLSRDLNMTRQPTLRTRFEAPSYVHVDLGSQSITVLNRGLPYHRFVSERMLDTLLIAGREQTRHFRLGLAVDTKHPWQCIATGFPDPWVVQAPRPTGHDRGWLLHVDARNIMLTSSEPILEAGACVGLRMRLLETEGRYASASVSCFREFGQAQVCNFLGHTESQARIESGAISTTLSPHDWVELEAYWS